MLIESVEIEGLGPFRERVALGPFSPGLNVLAEANEWGKSSVLKALTRAFFDKYSAQSAEIVALRPKGSTLSPRIGVIFSARGERWQLRKAFLDGKASELHRCDDGAWKLLDNSDKADAHVRELLGAPKLEGRAVKPETWGLLRYLWARQDETADWPKWDGAGGDEARRRLATVELDRTVRCLLNVLDEERAAILTETGRPKAKGPLDLAEQEMAGLETERARLLERREQTEALQQTYTRLKSEIVVLEKERARLSAEAGALQSATQAAEQGQKAVALFSQELQQAEHALRQVGDDLKTQARLADEAAALGEKIAEHQAAIRRVESEVPGLEAALAEARRAEQSAQEAHAAEERKGERLRALLRWRMAADEASALSSLQDRAKTIQDRLRVLEKERATLPKINPAQLKRWRALERSIADCETQIDVLGLRVTLTPEQAAMVQCDDRELSMAAGESSTLKAAQALTLRLAGWGRIEIHSGAREVEEIKAAQRAARRKLAGELSEAGLPTLAAAEGAAQSAATLETEITPLAVILADSFGKHGDAATLAAAATRAQAAADEQLTLAQPKEAETAGSPGDLQDQERAQTARVKASAQQLGEKLATIETARTNLENARRSASSARAEEMTLAARRTGLLEQEKMLTARHAGQLPEALVRAQSDFVKAEARLSEARRQLPANADKLPARSARATVAAAAGDAEHGRKARESRDVEVQLRERGGEGLFSRLATLEEKLELVQTEVTQARLEGRALRLAAEMIRRREQAAIQTVLRPLEERLGAVLGELTGERTRRVFFDEHLAIRGVGRNETEIVPFDDLSRGTREQLLLALRAAIALELSKEEPTCLILDDVLVHTDPVRQQNVLDYLQTPAPRVQVVILTCHAERYRGLGNLLVASR